MGVVYEAEDLERNQRVALKALKNTSADTLYRLKREFRALAEIQHPNLVSLYELFVTDACFITMELVSGVDLLSYVRTPSPRAVPASSGPLSRARYDEPRLRAALRQLARGLQALHGAGKIHRDVKPSNILVTPEGRVVLVDFGLVIETEWSSRQSQKGNAVGTVAYMAPEQCGGYEKLTPAADWYAFGVVLFEALTAELPFDGAPTRVAVDKQRQAPPSVRARVPGAPSDLGELCSALLQRDASARPTGPAILERLGAGTFATPEASDTPADRPTSLVGRDEALRVLRTRLDGIAEAQGGAVLVRGGFGMGKSAVLQQFVMDARVSRRDLVALTGRCYERETVPFKAMDSLVDDLSRYLRSIPEADAASLMPRDAWLLPRLFPVLGRVTSVATAPRAHPSADPQELRTRAFAALREVFQRLAERHPVLVTLDDMHWVDASTLNVLSDILRRPDPPPMLLVLAARPEGSAPLLDLLRRSGTAHAAVDLDPLPLEAATALAGKLLGPEKASLAAEVARESAGSPLLIGEMVSFVQTSAGSPLSSLRLDDVIGKRLSLVSPSGTRVLELVAVCGEPIGPRTLEIAAEVSSEELASELLVLRGLHLVRAVGSLADVHVETSHARVREVVQRLVTDPSRQAHCRRLALAMTTRKEGSSDRIALLWRAAGDVARAADQAIVAADEALFSLHFDRAVDLLQLVIDLRREDPARSLRDERAMLRKLGEALASAGRPRDAATALLEAAEGAEPGERLELRRRAADELLRGGYLEAGLSEVRAVLASIRLRLAPTPLQALLSLLLLRAWLTVRGLRFRERSISKIPPEELTKVDVCWSVAVGLAVVDNIRGADGQARHLALALAVGEPSRVARALAVEASFLASTGSPARARAVISRCRALADRIGSAYSTAFAAFAEGFVDYFCDSRWRAGVEHLTEAETLFRRHIAGGWEIDTSAMFACLCRLYQGELAALSVRVPALIHEAERRGDLYQTVSLRTRLNGVWLFSDDAAQAASDLAEAIGSWSSASYQVQHFFALGARCNQALYTGRPVEAAEHLARDARALRRSMLPRVTMVRIELADLGARIALARAAVKPSKTDRADAARVARAHARSLERERVPIGRALAVMNRAGAAQLAGETERAVAQLRLAVATFDAGETLLHAAVARRRLGEMLGGDEGSALVATAHEWFGRQGVRNPARVTAQLAPGWPEP